MDKNLLHGTHTALVTPFAGGKVNYEDLHKLLDLQISAGVSGVVPCGTTGESPTLSKDEHLSVIRETVNQVSGKIPVIAGTGANSTEEALHLTKNAQEHGVDGFLQVAPYYNKPSQEGLFAHFSAIAEITDKPIILYSIPSRCGIEISTDTILRLREKYPHVCALKEAGGKSAKVSDTLAKIDDEFIVLSGDDGLTLPFMACGAQGVISVASNLIPLKVVEMVNAALSDNFMHARSIHLKNYTFFNDIFCEPNPVPIKFLMHLKGLLSSPDVRLPLCPPSSSNKSLLEKIAHTK